MLLIKDMEMPKSCEECNLRKDNICKAKQDLKIDPHTRHRDHRCPLDEIVIGIDWSMSLKEAADNLSKGLSTAKQKEYDMKRMTGKS